MLSATATFGLWSLALVLLAAVDAAEAPVRSLVVIKPQQPRSLSADMAAILIQSSSRTQPFNYATLSAEDKRICFLRIPEIIKASLHRLDFEEAVLLSFTGNAFNYLGIDADVRDILDVCLPAWAYKIFEEEKKIRLIHLSYPTYEWFGSLQGVNLDHIREVVEKAAKLVTDS
jgi:hypothetical protein